MSLQEDSTLISNTHQVHPFEGDEPCFAADKHACTKPAGWTFQGKNGCTAHTATLIRKAARK